MTQVREYEWLAATEPFPDLDELSKSDLSFEVYGQQLRAG
jgi:hypothetical protein